MKKTHFRRSASLALACMLVLPLLSVLTGTAGAAGDPQVENILVTPEQITVEQGSSEKLDAQIYVTSPNGPVEDKTIVPAWTTAHPEVATVAPSADDPQRCVITTAAPGVTEVYAAVGDKVGKSEVTVSGLRLDKTSLDLFVNQSDTLRCDRFGSVKKVEPVWSSNNISVAEVQGGKVIAHYPGTAVITAKAGRYSVECQVTVREDIADAIPGTLDDHRLCKLSTFLPKLEEYSQTRAQGPLELLTNLSVPTSQGFLYRGYVSPEIQGHGVGSGESYYVNPGVGQSGISDVTFVPNPGFTGTAVISYTGRSTAGIPFFGTIRIEVKAQDDVTYHTSKGRPVSFIAEDFQAICRARTGRSARYLSFDPPTSDKGGLFRNYAVSGEYAQRVTKDMKLSTTKQEDELLSFVPAPDFVGTVVVPYVCEDAAGDTYTGRVTVIVQGKDGDPEVPSGYVTYRTTPNGIVNFRKDDLEVVCRTATGEGLDSVRFWYAPGANTGRLLYDGQEDAYADKKDYFLTGKDRPLLEKLSYRAPMEQGTYYIELMGRSVKGQIFSGRIAVTVEGSSAVSTTTVSYQGSSLPVPFRTMDFHMASLGEAGGKLASVHFLALPDRTEGVLYLDEKKPLDSLETYTAEEGVLDRISFVARAGYHGTCKIPYEGVSKDGRRFYGDVEITISDRYCPATFFDMEKGWSWARPSVEYLRWKGIVNGRQDTVYDPANSVSRGEFVVMVCRAFGYTSSGSSSFTDVSSRKFYASAIAAAQERGILPDTGKRFYPDKPISRQDAASILYGALRVEGKISPHIDTGILNRFADGGKVSAPAKKPMAALVQLGVFKGDDRNTLRPASPISRAEIAVILHRALTQ